MDSLRILLLVGAFALAVAATKLGEQVNVHEEEKPTDEKTENFKRVGDSAYKDQAKTIFNQS